MIWLLSIVLAPAPQGSTQEDPDSKLDEKELKDLGKIRKIKDPLERLKALYAFRTKSLTYLKANGRSEKVFEYESRQCTAPAVLSFRSGKVQDKESALLWDEQEPSADGTRDPIHIKTLVKSGESVVHYPLERTAYVYDLSKDRNLPWQYVLFNGINDALEERFKITVIKDPEPPDAEKKPDKPSDDPPPSAEAGVMGGAVGPAMSAIGIDLYDLHYYVLSLEPKDRRLRERVAWFMVWIEPKDCTFWMVHYKDRAEETIVRFSDYERVDYLDDALFEIDLADPNLKVTRR